MAWGFYAIMRVLSTDVLTDTILTLGMMICFYYGVILAVIFATTLIDSTDHDYGSGSKIGGVGLVFILGVFLLLTGVVLMFVMRAVDPAFFRGETLRRGAPRA